MSRVIKSVFAIAKSPYLVMNNDASCTMVYENKDIAEQANNNAECYRQLELLKLEAQKEAGELIAQAKIDAQSIIQSAQTEAESKKKQIFEEAYLEGCNKGVEQGKLEVRKIIEEANEVLDLAYKKKEEILKTIEPEIAQIIISAVKKIVAIESIKPQQVLYTIRNSVEKINKQERLTIKVNPNDLETVKKAQEDLVKWEVVPYINIEDDPLIKTGGCIIETEYGSIDGRISSQLDEMERVITGAAKDA